MERHGDYLMPEIVEFIRDGVVVALTNDAIEIHDASSTDIVEVAGYGPIASLLAYLLEDGYILLAEDGGYLLLE